ncbi:hypothetical protein EDB81DRAFT_892205 [Dactylonectria macrodidyma]|uniref:Uncharacterized protein n=1 Tax=Dactylonectria macrodidyma TaxID=307937 RepID=A0A9P9DDE6_9HYPO|nr:hypothetical protein EDB81DRAFT_892205 [Dactylonectria macrodidyma]
MTLVATHTGISAPPDVVRAKFLAFSSLGEYKPALIRSITVLESNKTPMELVPGDKLECVLDGATLITTIAQNNASCFSWTGSLAGGLLHGEHRFRFESINGGLATDFYHEETFTGYLSWVLGEGFLARKLALRNSTLELYCKFNRDFKRWVEETSSAISAN